MTKLKTTPLKLWKERLESLDSRMKGNSGALEAVNYALKHPVSPEEAVAQAKQGALSRKNKQLKNSPKSEK